jgi:hypothetical protein
VALADCDVDCHSYANCHAEADTYCRAPNARLEGLPMTKLRNLWDYLVVTKFRILSLVMLLAGAVAVAFAAAGPPTTKWLWGLGLALFFGGMMWLMSGTAASRTGNWHPTDEAASTEDTLMGLDKPEEKPKEEGFR